MVHHSQISQNELKNLIRQGKIKFAGNIRLKTYGLLACASGKGMKKEHRVFFKNEDESTKAGFRPCGHCMRIAYNFWKVMG